MVVGGMLGHVADKLGHLHVVLQLPLEAPKQHLTLAGLEAVDHRWDGTDHVGLGEEHQLLVDEVCVPHLFLGVVHKVPLLVAIDPVLSVVGALLVKGQVDGPIVLGTLMLVAHLVVLDLAEVFLRLLRCAGAQALVVLGPVALPAIGLLLPSLILGHGVEAYCLLALRCLHDRGEELLHKAWQPGQRWPPCVDEVDEQTLDVRAVMVLVRHDHDRAVTEALELGVVLAVEIKAHDLDDILNLRVGHHLMQGGIAHIQQLPA
mmetsp:Transcript_113556/g.242368  ORF Transcript_113556/g.242368 Transcript_113556/m.242368 type:complete len:261 (-) Transcript_113556:1491-2273(-)